MGSNVSKNGQPLQNTLIQPAKRACSRSVSVLANLMHVWFRFWIFATGWEHQEWLWKHLYHMLKYRKYQIRNSRDAKIILGMHSFDWKVLSVLVEVLLRLCKSLLVPHLFMRYLWATSILHIVYEMGAYTKKCIDRSVMKLTRNGRKMLRMEKKFELAETFQERQLVAMELDAMQSKDTWREDPASDYYLYKRVMNKTESYQQLLAHKDVIGIMFALRAGLLRKHWGLGHPKLYSVSKVGTKRVIEDYLNIVVRSMNMVLKARGDTLESQEDLSLDNKLAFFSETRHAFGRSALLLSGGGALGMYHSGVLKALIEQHMLPTVIAGSSAGSICAGIVGVRTDEEMLSFFENDDLDLNFLSINIQPLDLSEFTPKFLPAFRRVMPHSLYQKLQHSLVILFRFLRKGYVLDSNVLRDTLRRYIGDYTFREAYDRTGRIINITVTQSKASDYPHLLNYLTAPNALIWSACLASCAIPILFPSIELLAKDKTGNIVPYFREGLKWSDGSIECDLPMERLSELFNVNHFIVSQVNLHYKFVSGYGSIGWCQAGSLIGFLKQQMKAHIKHLAEFGLNTTVLKFLDIGVIPLLTQKYEGDITICPTENISLVKLTFESLANFTMQQYKQVITKAGERACWSCISRIQTMCRIEFALERAVRYLKGEKALEEERRHGKRIGRVPSFYTSPSSLNLLSLDQDLSTLSLNNGEKKKSKSTLHLDKIKSRTALRRVRSVNIAGAVMTMEHEPHSVDSLQDLMIVFVANSACILSEDESILSKSLCNLRPESLNIGCGSIDAVEWRINMPADDTESAYAAKSHRRILPSMMKVLFLNFVCNMKSVVKDVGGKLQNSAVKAYKALHGFRHRKAYAAKAKLEEAFMIEVFDELYNFFEDGQTQYTHVAEAVKASPKTKLQSNSINLDQWRMILQNNRAETIKSAGDEASKIPIAVSNESVQSNSVDLDQWRMLLQNNREDTKISAGNEAAKIPIAASNESLQAMSIGLDQWRKILQNNREDTKIDADSASNTTDSTDSWADHEGHSIEGTIASADRLLRQASSCSAYTVRLSDYLCNCGSCPMYAFIQQQVVSSMDKDSQIDSVIRILQAYSTYNELFQYKPESIDVARQCICQSDGDEDLAFQRFTVLDYEVPRLISLDL